MGNVGWQPGRTRRTGSAVAAVRAVGVDAAGAGVGDEAGYAGAASVILTTMAAAQMLVMAPKPVYVVVEDGDDGVDSRTGYCVTMTWRKDEGVYECFYVYKNKNKKWNEMKSVME